MSDSILGWAKFIYDFNRNKQQDAYNQQLTDNNLAPARAANLVEQVRGADPNKIIQIGPMAGKTQAEVFNDPAAQQRMIGALPTAQGAAIARRDLRMLGDSRFGGNTDEDIKSLSNFLSPQNDAERIKYASNKLAFEKDNQNRLERVETGSGYAYMPSTISPDFQGNIPVRQVENVLSEKAASRQQQAIKDARDLRNKNFEQADKLRDEFVKGSGDFVKIRDAYGRIEASSDEPSAAGDLALIFNYMKMLDPGSVVRESEFANAAATGAFGERIKAAAAKIASGERLSDEMRKDFVSRSKKLMDKTDKYHNQLTKEYTRLAKQNNIDPTNVIIDYRVLGNKPVEQMSDEELIKALTDE